jgi:hypothetical protein
MPMTLFKLRKRCKKLIKIFKPNYTISAHDGVNKIELRSSKEVMQKLKKLIEKKSFLKEIKYFWDQDAD